MRRFWTPDVVVQGGNDTAWSNWPRLDFNFASRDRLLLLPGITLTFRRLAILNIFSRSQQSYDYFASTSSSSIGSSSNGSSIQPAVVWVDVVDRRLLCPPLPGVVDTWRATPRPVTAAGGIVGSSSTTTSGSGGQDDQQSVTLDTTPVCDDAAGASGVSGRCFTPVMRAADVQADTSQGFRIGWNNTLTLCEQFLPDACIQQQGLEGCYLTSIEALLAQRAQSQQTTESKSSEGSGGGGGGLSPGAQTGLIVGFVVGGVLLAAGVALCLWQRQRRSDGEAVVAGHVLAAYASHDKDGTAGHEDLESGMRRGDTANTRGRPSTTLHHAASSGAASAGGAGLASGHVSNANGGGGGTKGRRGSSADAGTIDSSCPITDCTTHGSGGLRASAQASAEVSALGGACAGAAALGLGGSTSGEVAAALAAAGVRSGDWRAAVAAVAAKAGGQQQQQQQQQQQAQAGQPGDSEGSIGSGMLVLGGASSSRMAALGGSASGNLGAGAGRASSAAPNAANASTNPLFSLPEVEQGAASGDAAGSAAAGTPRAAAAAAAAGAGPNEPRAGTHAAGAAGPGSVLISTTAAATAATGPPGGGAAAAAAAGPADGSMQSAGSLKLLMRLRSLIHRGGSRTPTTAGGTTGSGSGAAAASSGSLQPKRAKSATLSDGKAGGIGGAAVGSHISGAPSGDARAASAGMHGLAAMLKSLRLGHGATSDGGSSGADSTPTAAGAGTSGARAAAAAAMSGQAGAGGPLSGAGARDAMRPPTRLSFQVSLASGDAHAHALAAARGSNASAASGVTGRPSLCEMQRELERIEGELHKEDNKRSRSKGTAAHTRSGRPSLGSRPPNPGAAAGAANSPAARNVMDS
ncbi:hypothetical protein HYH02_002172 [Chlamydomonas schloesseri]|uniref:Uncharacterized protein n=1 Tax=Chlamydomonas schloesseri TaxID=2026947 RepID=A0A836BAM9_9CHLO|nr:hypothetical protein HYH02_002172 [Chlamydomonas schloesseri]|eukprot:KAG2452826.1 hypothetical protein HYH02_002172 [Chlamydomonas schloesseri]